MEKENKKSAVKKVLGIILNVIVYLFFALCVFMLIITVTAKKDSDGAMIIFGHEMRIVISPSMEKCDQTDVSNYKIKDIPVKSAVFIELVPEDKAKADEWYSKLEVGDVLTFAWSRYTSADFNNKAQPVITHRITEIVKKETGGYIITLAGDNKNSDSGVLEQVIDTSVPQGVGFDYVIGKVTGVSLPIGLMIYAVSQPVGMVLIIIVPCAIIMILMIIRLINAIFSDKREKAKKEIEDKSSEIEELKRKLAELQGENAEKDLGNGDGEQKE